MQFLALIVTALGGLILANTYIDSQLAIPSPTPTLIEEEIITETPIPTSIPTTVIMPTARTLPKPTTDPDPIITCNFTYTGSRQMRRSECNISFNCQIGNNWYVYTSREKCTQDQNAQIVKQGNPQPILQGSTQTGYTQSNSFSCTTIYGTYTSSSQQACDQLKDQAQAMQDQNLKTLDAIKKLDQIGNTTFQITPIPTPHIVIPTVPHIPLNNPKCTVLAKQLGCID